MPSYTPLAVVYGSDEDICIRAEGDYSVLVPKAQKRATGTDGTTSGWTVTSVAVDFQAQGVRPGMVALLSFPDVAGSNAGKAKVPGDRGEMFAVDTVSAKVLTVRRVGEASGVGQPPVATSSVAFLIQTFAPQIDDVSYELNRRFGVDPTIPGRTPARLHDIRETNQVCTLTVLERQYVAQARQAGDGKGDDFWAKAKYFAQIRDDALDRLALHWASVSGFGVTQPPESTTRFSTRIGR